MDLEDGGPLEAMMDLDAVAGPTQVKWRLFLVDNGGRVKTEVPKPNFLHHDNGGIQGACESAGEMNKTKK